ncbi:MAG: 2-hydroxyacyl-CoA dehydratase family protein [Candidatus Aminicenantes bacterium]|jgi:benzoyl-CoA reductase/2-hydroxyglutaryl-CoA dehydratase subunit BcrC/BadD/HgdB
MFGKKTKKEVPRIPAMFANNLMTKYYKSVNQAKAKGKIAAWVNLGLPAGFLYSFEDIFPIYPQFHSELQAVIGKFREMANALEGKWEMPKEICPEAKSVIGLVLYDNLFSFRIPSPDFLITTNAACQQAPQAFKVVHRYLNVPYYSIDMPVLFEDLPDAKSVDYVYQQLEDAIAKIEGWFQVKFNEEKFIKWSTYTLQMYIVWEEILKLFRFSPCPMDGQDLLLFFQPFTFADLTIEGGDTLKMYITLYNELYQRVTKDQKSHKTAEKYRMLWDLQPIVSKRNFIKNILMRYDAAVVMTTLLISGFSLSNTGELVFDFPLTKEQIEHRTQEVMMALAEINTMEHLDRQKMMKLMAMVILTNLDYKRPLSYNYKKFKKSCRDYHIDAVIMNMNNSCRMVSSSQAQVMGYIRDELKLPVLKLDVNPMDPRCFSGAQIKTRIEAFMENLD